MTIYARGKSAWGYCARSGKRALLKDLIPDGHYPNLLVLPEWWEPKHPQETPAKVFDPMALRRPSPNRDRPGHLIVFPTLDSQLQVQQNLTVVAIVGDVTVTVV